MQTIQWIGIILMSGATGVLVGMIVNDSTKK